MAVAQKRARQSIEQSMNIIRGSGEPTVTQDQYKIELIRALSWYGVNADEKTLRSYIERYLKQAGILKQYSSHIGKAPLYDLKVMGSLCRLIAREQYVSFEHLAWLQKTLDSLVKNTKKSKEDVKAEEQKPVVPGNPIQDRILETVRRHAAEFDAAIDDFATYAESEFSAKAYLLSNSVPGVVAKKLGMYYQQLAEELGEAVAGKDNDLKEGYGNFRKVHLRHMSQFVQQIVADCSQQVVSAKATRKPRARKVKPPAVIVKNMKYMKAFPALKLTSVSPEKIIGATEVWVYAPEKRKLSVFYGAHGGDLGVKGASIINYDVITSMTKTIRRPEEFFKGLSSTGKRAMTNAWKALGGKGTKVRARMSEEMIILAVN